MVVSIASDHAGYELRQKVKKYLEEKGFEVLDGGAPNGTDSYSYVDAGIKVAEDGKVEKTIDRKKVWMAQTPQAASVDLLKKLYDRIDKEPLNFTPTDEASILEFFGEQVYIVQGNAMNDKLTTPEDFEIFSARLAAK